MTPRHPDELSLAAQISHWATIGSMLVALSYYIGAPFLALTWSKLPFPGFVIEQTGVVANIHSPDWSGYNAGIRYPQQVVALADQPVSSPLDFRRILQKIQPGQLISVVTAFPDGSRHKYSSIETMHFPSGDLLHLFWYPYIVGGIYLLVAGLVYIVRGNRTASRSFAFFCACASIASTLTFDTSTTHVGIRLWTLALAMLGGSLTGLSILFPEEMPIIYRRAGIRLMAYLTSIALAFWGLSVVSDIDNPWAYIQAWRVSYFFIAFGLILFFGSSYYRMNVTASHVVRQQVRLILFGSLMAFLPLVVWMLSPMAGMNLPWNPAIYILPLVAFPLSVSIAILRYRLWTVDVIVRRTLTYAVLTGLLSVIYFFSVIVLQNIFKGLTGGNSRLAIVLSTLIIVALSRPLFDYARRVIDRRFYRSKYDAVRALESFSVFLRDEVELETLAARIVWVVEQTLRPESVNITLLKIDADMEQGNILE